VSETSNGFRVLFLNDKSWEILRSQRKVTIAVPRRITGRAGTRESERAMVAELLFEELRHLRKQLADEQGIAPYVVFADSSLRAMAQQQPRTLGAFAKVPGVVEAKLQRYGSRFLAEIESFLQTQAPNPTGLGTDTQQFTLQLYQQGLNIPEIADQRGLRPTTIIRHLGDLIEQGEPVDIDRLVSPEHQAVILDYLTQYGEDSLTLMRDRLGEDYTFDELRLVRGKWRQQR